MKPPKKKPIATKATPASHAKKAGDRPSNKPASTGKPATAARKSSAPRRPASPRDPNLKARTRLAIPPILLEGDRPAGRLPGGPGERYALGPTPPPAHFLGLENLGELPEAYGTRRLLLTARDPHWLYAHWDFTREQLRQYNALASEGHLTLRVYVDKVEGTPVGEVQVHPESRNWFVHVGRGGTRYASELGYYAKSGRRWERLAVSHATFTPPDTLSPDTNVVFATFPTTMPQEILVELVRRAVLENVPLSEVIQQLRTEGHLNLPGLTEIRAPEWTPAQEKALGDVVTMDQVRRVWMGSLEITELIRRQMVTELASAAAAEFSAPGPGGPGAGPGGGVSSVSSPYGGGVAGRKGFWFKVNAELIIYGATEPNARVSIGGREIRLRSDGSFSYRFALPDGQYSLPAVAVSAQGDDQREARLEFSRHTEYAGDVGAHAQDEALRTPKAEHLS